MIDEQEQVIEDFNKLWEENKFDIVPGDKVIDLFCLDYKVRYKKTEADIDLLTNLRPKGLIATLDRLVNEVGIEPQKF